MQRTKYFYVLDNGTGHAHYIGTLESGLTAAIYDVLKPGHVPYVTDTLSVPGERIRLIASWFTVQFPPE